MDTKAEDKLIAVDELVGIIRDQRSQGKIVVFTNGCFDLIHTGHTRYLRQARDAGDMLIVAVNSDNSVKKLKGISRPIVPLNERMEILAGFYFIDYVVAFDELDPYKLISTLKPNRLIKGGDWPLDKIIGRDVVEANGGSVFTIPQIPGRSTTSIVEKIQQFDTGDS